MVYMVREQPNISFRRPEFSQRHHSPLMPMITKAPSFLLSLSLAILSILNTNSYYHRLENL